MLISKNKQLGVTLIEILLVLAIISVMLILSINQVQLFRFDSQVREIQYNVNNVFEGISNYYKANCYGNASSTLYQDATKNADSTAYSKGLKITGDLANFLPSPLISSPLINQPPYTQDNISVPYKAQLNLITYKRKVCPYSNTGDANGNNKCTNTTPSIPMATVLTWQAQVAVQLPAGVDPQAYLGYLGGDCLSESDGDLVKPCSQNSGGTEYVVWQRQPSLGGSVTPAEGWLANPLVTQFTQEYQTAPGLYLTNTSGNVYPNFSATQQYLQCTD